MNPLYTVGNQMIEGIRRHRKISKSEAEEKAVQSLEAVNLANARQLMKKYPFELAEECVSSDDCYDDVIGTGVSDCG
ncbi:MAG: hypothetical protein ACLTSZ_15930 [Lachnospiraceae bacterium]